VPSEKPNSCKLQIQLDWVTRVNVISCCLGM